MTIIHVVIAIAVLLLATALLLLFILKAMKRVMDFVKTIILNSIVGLIALFLLYAVGIKVPLTLPVLLSIALFGLPALATILILILLGANL